MVVNYNLYPLLHHNLVTFPNTQKYLLRDLYKDWIQRKPLSGIRLLHNIPLTYETLMKLESLLISGAEVTVTQLKFLKQSPEKKIVNLLNRVGVNYVEHHDNLSGEFDVALDCCGEVLDMEHVTIRKGIVELTQTGEERYRQVATPFPVISVNESNLKKLEGMYGTGEAFVRAIKERTGRSIKNLPFMVFGFGKVGQGIVRYLSKETSNIIIVERDEKPLNQARDLGFEALDSAQLDKIRKLAQDMFCLVTATGESHVLAKYLNPEYCSKAFIANMGATDEIGPTFSNQNILCSGMPINFSLKHPTLLNFIDPVFYAHNLATQLLLEHNYASGYHPFPNYLDNAIIKMWNAYNPVDISDIYFK